MINSKTGKKNYRIWADHGSKFLMSLKHDDVSHVVALASALKLHDIRRTGRYRKPDFPGDISSLLDALAGICVSEEIGVSLAVGVQILPQNSIRFTFASDVNQTKKRIDRKSAAIDKDKEISITSHVHSVWSILQDISESCRLQDRDELGLQRDLETFCHKEIGQLKTIIYNFGYKKFRHRVLKNGRWDEFCLFTEICRDVEQQASISEFYGDLQELYSFLSVLIHEHLKREDYPGEGFLYLVAGVGTLGRRILTRYGTSCVSICAKVSKDQRWKKKDLFPLEDYIHKVIALERYINEILGFTAFLRNREIILRQPEVVHVSSLSYPISEPSSWDEILTTSLEAGCRIPKDKPKLVEQLDTALPLSSSSSSSHAHPFFKTHYPIHCEVALINYYVSNPSLPPLRQLGVSKKTCSACSSYIKASNKSRNIKFYTKECNGKWYFPWSLSSYDPDVILRQTFADIIKKIMLCLVVQGQAERPAVTGWKEEAGNGEFEVDAP